MRTLTRSDVDSCQLTCHQWYAEAEENAHELALRHLQHFSLIAIERSKRNEGNVCNLRRDNRDRRFAILFSAKLSGSQSCIADRIDDFVIRLDKSHILHRLRNVYVEELCFGQFLLRYDPLCALQRGLGGTAQLHVGTLKLDRLAGSLQNIARFLEKCHQLFHLAQLHCYSFWLSPSHSLDSAIGALRAKSVHVDLDHICTREHCLSVRIRNDGIPSPLTEVVLRSKKATDLSDGFAPSSDFFDTMMALKSKAVHARQVDNGDHCRFMMRFRHNAGETLDFTLHYQHYMEQMRPGRSMLRAFYVSFNVFPAVTVAANKLEHCKRDIIGEALPREAAQQVLSYLTRHDIDACQLVTSKWNVLVDALASMLPLHRLGYFIMENLDSANETSPEDTNRPFRVIVSKDKVPLQEAAYWDTHPDFVLVGSYSPSFRKLRVFEELTHCDCSDKLRIAFSHIRNSFVEHIILPKGAGAPSCFDDHLESAPLVATNVYVNCQDQLQLATERIPTRKIVFYDPVVAFYILGLHGHHRQDVDIDVRCPLNVNFVRTLLYKFESLKDTSRVLRHITVQTARFRVPELFRDAYTTLSTAEEFDTFNVYQCRHLMADVSGHSGTLVAHVRDYENQKTEQTSAPRRVLFQSADGGILRQFQVNKNSLAYRILMAVVNEAQDSSRNNLDSAQTVAPYKALFQWVDGGILRQIELNKDSEKYRILMAVIKEFQLILTRDDAGPAQTFAPPKKDVPIQPPGSAPVPTSSNSASNPPSSSQTMQRPAQQSTTSNLTTTSASPAFKLDCFSNGRSAPTGRSDANNSSKDRAQSPQSPTNDQSQLTSSSYSRITRSQTRNIENKPGPTNVYLPSRRPRRLRN